MAPAAKRTASATIVALARSLAIALALNALYTLAEAIVGFTSGRRARRRR
jgi:hypothetical protein